MPAAPGPASPSHSSPVASVRETPIDDERSRTDRSLLCPDALSASSIQSLRVEAIDKIVLRLQCRSVRCWIPGCGGGLDAYRVAAQIDDAARMITHLGRTVPDLKIFATDLSAPRITFATIGRYQGGDLTPLADEEKDKTLQSMHEGWRVRPAIRRHVIFSPHDLTSDPPFLRLDLIVNQVPLASQNEFDRQLILRRLDYALSPGGFVSLGSDVSDAFWKKRFRQLDRDIGLYEKIVDTPPPSMAGTYPLLKSIPQRLASSRERLSQPLPSDQPLAADRDENKSNALRDATSHDESHGESFASLDRSSPSDAESECLIDDGVPITSGAETVAGVDESDSPRGPAVRWTSETPSVRVDALMSQVTTRWMPPGLIVDGSHRVIHTFGDLRDFFQYSSGRFEHGFLKLLPPTLLKVLRTGLKQVFRSRQPVRMRGVSHPRTGQTMTLRVDPLRSSSGSDFASIVFEGAGCGSELASSEVKTPHSEAGESVFTRNEYLENELRDVRQRLNESVHELDASYEELQAVNEELVAGNEELREANQELLSVNQELRVINEEHRTQMIRLASATTDMDHLIASTRYGVLFVDRDLTIRRFTPWVSDLFGLTGAESGRPVNCIADYSEAYEPIVAAIKQVANDLREREWLMGLDDRNYLLRAMPYDDDGEPGGVVLAIVDFTRRHGEEVAMQQAVEQSDRANAAKNDFLTKLSHELRTPLAAVLGFAEILENDAHDDRNRRSHANRIARNARQLQVLVSDLMDVSRIEADVMHLHPQPVAPLELLEDVIATLRQMPGCGQRLRFECSSKLPSSVLLDGPRFKQVVTNLVANALKFDRSGEVVVEAGSKAHPSEPSRTILQFAVRDTGIGIDPLRIGEIFKPRVQASATTESQFGGTGMGLFICKRLIELMGGTMTVESEIGQGSCFGVEVPVEMVDGGSQTREDLGDMRSQDAASIGVASREARMSAPHVSSDLLRGVSGLVADDVADARFIANHFLTAAGASVETFRDGYRLWTTLRKRQSFDQPIDFVLLDMHMPTMDGTETLRAIRDANIDVAVIALTADAMEGMEDKVLGLGFDAYLPKPIDAKVLVATVAAAVERRRALSQD